MGKDWKSWESDKIQLCLGGVHQPEPQCHVDPKFQLNLKNRGFLFSVLHELEMYVWNERGEGKFGKMYLLTLVVSYSIHVYINPWGVLGGTSARTKMSH